MTYIKEQNLFHNSFKQVVQQGPTNAPWDHRCHIYFITFNSFPTRVILWSYSAFVKLLRLQSTAIYVWNAIKERAQPLSTDMKFPMCVIYSAYFWFWFWFWFTCFNLIFWGYQKTNKQRNHLEKKCAIDLQVSYLVEQMNTIQSILLEITEIWISQQSHITAYTVTLTSAVCMEQEWVWGNGDKRQQWKERHLGEGEMASKKGKLSERWTVSESGR